MAGKWRDPMEGEELCNLYHQVFKKNAEYCIVKNKTMTKKILRISHGRFDQFLTEINRQPVTGTKFIVFVMLLLLP